MCVCLYTQTHTHIYIHTLLALTVNNLPGMQKTQVQDPLEKEMATQSSILAWEISWAEQLGRLHTVHGVAKSQTGLSNRTTTRNYY